MFFFREEQRGKKRGGVQPPPNSLRDGAEKKKEKKKGKERGTPCPTFCAVVRLLSGDDREYGTQGGEKKKGEKRRGGGKGTSLSKESWRGGGAARLLINPLSKRCPTETKKESPALADVSDRVSGEGGIKENKRSLPEKDARPCSPLFPPGGGNRGGGGKSRKERKKGKKKGKRGAIICHIPLLL